MVTMVTKFCLPVLFEILILKTSSLACSCDLYWNFKSFKVSYTVGDENVTK